VYYCVKVVKKAFKSYGVLSFEINEYGNPLVLVITDWCSILCVCFQC